MIGIVCRDHTRELGDEIRLELRRSGADAWISTDLQTPDWSRTEVLINAMVPCGAAEMDAAPDLRAIVSPLLGYDWIDVEAATHRGIAVVNGAADVNHEGMAEAAITLILALLYRLREAEAAMQLADGRPRRARMLKGRTVGIVGVGAITRALVVRLSAWGCRIVVNSRLASAPPPGSELMGLEDLLSVSDVVVVAASLVPATRRLLNRERLLRMKPDAVLVNIARGALIDEAALVEILRDGRIAGAALDVFEVEPLPADHPLRKLNNVILTPHVIGHTEESAVIVPRLAAENALALAAGIVPFALKNPQLAAAWRARFGQASKAAP